MNEKRRKQKIADRLYGALFNIISRREKPCISPNTAEFRVFVFVLVPKTMIMLTIDTQLTEIYPIYHFMVKNTHVF